MKISNKNSRNVYTLLVYFVGEGMWFSHRKWLHQNGWSGASGVRVAKYIYGLVSAWKRYNYAYWFNCWCISSLFSIHSVFIFSLRNFFFTPIPNWESNRTPNQTRTETIYVVGYHIIAWCFSYYLRSIRYLACKYIDCANMFGYFMLWILHFLVNCNRWWLVTGGRG